MAGPIHVYGIRHHGPGSARSLRQALESLKPDAILVEGPPDAAEVLPLLAHAGMKPPVALLVYARDEPQHAVYYPFAEFSPEWQALAYGLRNQVEVRFIDLPQAQRMALAAEREPTADGGPPTVDGGPPTEEDPPAGAEDLTPNTQHLTPDPDPRRDPLGWLAEAAGYGDGERWWDQMVEHRRDGEGLFEAILEAMTALRAELPPEPDPDRAQQEALREAWMRTCIRAAVKEGFERIAVVCGAWHAPVLAAMPPAREDAALLKGLPKLPVMATWVPWTYGRLAMESGYGAGIESPGWYHHLWTHEDHSASRWLAGVARLLREKDLDASSAHVIEAVRLAETLAALRGRPLAGLPELTEATQSVLCYGSDVPLQLIREKLLVGERLGEVPDETPMVPLQQDLIREQRRLRLAPEAGVRDLDLDLRKPNEMDRSRLLHRLNLLGVPWGQPQRTYSQKGTFHELWRLQWHPEFAVRLIEAGIWGSTILTASTGYARDAAAKAPDLPHLTQLLDGVLLADLPEAVTDLMARIQAEAARASDLSHLMEALPPLVHVVRYGNVRKTDVGMVGHVVDGLVARVCIGLPGATASLNDEAAAAMLKHVLSVNEALTALNDAEHLAAWRATLARLADQAGLHGLVQGRACRLLLDARAMEPEDVARRLGLALSRATEPAQAAAWVEGFLQGSGQVLLLDEKLWAVVDAWISGLDAGVFEELLPLLRRTFSTFPAPERRQMGERVRRGGTPSMEGGGDGSALDHERAAMVLPILRQILGLQSVAA